MEALNPVEIDINEATSLWSSKFPVLPELMVEMTRGLAMGGISVSIPPNQPK